jgi:cytochrome c-type biogenesis protein CcmH
MTRRGWLRGWLGAGAFRDPASRRARDARGERAGGVRQDPPAGRGAADPLRDPGAAGMRRAVVTARDNDEVIKAIERRLKCTCGCNLDIFTCRTTDFTCTASPALHQEVLALDAAGQTPDQIVAAFATKHGEAVLLKPRVEGFNLLGYWLPATAVLLAAGLIGFILLRRHRRGLAVAPAATSPYATATPLTAEQDARLARALSEIEP